MDLTSEKIDIVHSSQKFDYFLVLDFEATCEDRKKFEPQEIIEFPCLLVCGKTLEVVDTFHSYVQPVAHPTLTPFCTSLTGIQQSVVEEAPTFHEVLENFLDWYKMHDLENKVITFVTCGNWDLASMLPRQCQCSNIQVPSCLSSASFINIKYSFKSFTGKKSSGLLNMLIHFELDFEGRHHSRIDDCRNIHRVLQNICFGGFIMENNGIAAVEKERKNERRKKS